MPLRVSVVIPARNEERHIEACIRAIQGQQFDGELEIIVADGRSADDTAALACRLGAKVVDNPERITPTALNRALAAAEGDVVLRFDAHSQMGQGYIEACIRALREEQDVGNVGGWCDIRGDGDWSRAIAAALSSRFGVGNPRLWRTPRNGEGRRDVESVPFGCFPASVLREVGGWRPDLVRNQDFELNHRLRATGRRVVFDPAISFVYRPRESLHGVCRQYWHFGRWKGVVLLDAPRSLRPRQLAPVGLLATVALAVTPTPAARLARAALTAYIALVSGVAVRSGAGWRTAPVLTTIHLVWGAGLVSSVAELTVHRIAARRRTVEHTAR